MQSIRNDILNQLPADHLLSKLYAEHEIIISILDSMESDAGKLREAQHFEQAEPTIRLLKLSIENLLAAEPHHQREEQVLFPQMEKRGISGPPSVMRMEHETLREKKHYLEKLLSKEPEDDFRVFQENISNTAQSIVGLLMAHIHKENMILYPMAFRVINEDAVWSHMMQQSEKIGNCSFILSEAEEKK